MECPAPPAVTYTTITNTIPATYVYLDQIIYDCVIGYELSGGDLIHTCLETSYWDGNEPNCTSKSAYILLMCNENKILVEIEVYSENVLVMKVLLAYS